MPQTQELSQNVSQIPAGFTPSAGGRPVKTAIQRETRRWPEMFNGSPRAEQNVGDAERLTSLAAGSIVTILGLSRRSLPGLVVAAAGTALAFRGASGHCAMYEVLGVDTAHEVKPAETEKDVEIAQSFSVNAPPEKLYSFWRKLEQLPQVLEHIESIKETNERQSHWKAKPMKGMKAALEWDAEIIQDEPNKLIAWRSLPGSNVETSGEIRFTQGLGDRGTAVKVKMTYRPVGGMTGKMIAKIFGQAPERIIRGDLRNFKRFMELGEVLTTHGQTQGQCAGRSSMMGGYH